MINVKRLFLIGSSLLPVLFAQAQTAPGMQWVLPIKAGRVPIGKPAGNAVPYRENNALYLQALGQPAVELPFDSISYLDDGYFKIWQDHLQGIFHPELGAVIPPVYDVVKPIGPKPEPWAFEISKYGMVAVADEMNRLILPWSKSGYGKTAAFGDSILEYQRSRVGFSYIARSGNPVDEATARLSKPADFQRITTEWTVLTTSINGRVRRDTFRESEPFADDIAPVRTDSLWGYIRRDASWLIKPRFQVARPFGPLGHAVVKVQGKYGVIRRNGTFLVEPRFAFLKPFVPGLFEFKEGEQTGLIDSVGNVVVPLGTYGGFIAAGKNATAVKSADSLLLFRNDGQPIRIGKVVNCFSNRVDGSFIVHQKKRVAASNHLQDFFGVLSERGEWLLEPVFQRHFREHRHFYVAVAMLEPCCTIPGIALEQNDRDKFLLFNRAGQAVAPFAVGGFPGPGDSPFIIYKIGNLYGLSTSTGVALAAEYDAINDMGNGWAYVRKGDTWGALKWVE